MSSTRYVDFSIRQNKTIERLVVFDGLKQIVKEQGLTDCVYVGFGSVWFTDFTLAHRDLGVETMISIESDATVFKRATFNRPFRTLEVIEGRSNDVIPELLANRPDLSERPWIVWLDYDERIDETKLDELAYLIASVPPNSTLLVTFNASRQKYGSKPVERETRLRALFGDALDDNPFAVPAEVRDEQKVMKVLADATESFMVAKALQSARLGGIEIPFKLLYQDGSPMVTVGAHLPSPEMTTRAESLFSMASWPGRVSGAIATSPLTMREVSALQAMLPRQEALTRSDVRSLGFDLEEDQIESYVAHYLRYPTFARLVV